MNPQQDYAALWPDLFQGLPASTRDTVLHALRKSAEDGTPPDRIDAGILIDFATGQISAREYGRRTIARLMDVPEENSAPPSTPSTPSAPPMSLVPTPLPGAWSPAVPESPAAPVAQEGPATDVPTGSLMLDHDEAALAFVRGEVTVEQYLQNARRLRGNNPGI